MGRSSFDRVGGHLRERGPAVAVPAELREDVEVVVRRCEEVNGLGAAFYHVELSPFMKSLLRVSGMDTQEAVAASSAAVAGG